MIEVPHVRQVPGDARRRWFADDNFDLMVWYHVDDSVHGFELSYNKAGHEKALRWFDNVGLSHYAVDTGEQNPAYNRSPILSQIEGSAGMKRVLESFHNSTKGLPEGLGNLVERKLVEYGQLKHD